MLNLGPEWAGFGRYLRHLRSTRSLREVASLAGSSKSVLSLVERGERVPTIDLVSSLDTALAADGSLLARYNDARAERSKLPSRWRREWIHHFPATYSGPVYTRVLVPAPVLPAEIAVVLRWGPVAALAQVRGAPGRRASACVRQRRRRSVGSPNGPNVDPRTTHLPHGRSRPRSD